MGFIANILPGLLVSAGIGTAAISVLVSLLSLSNPLMALATLLGGVGFGGLIAAVGVGLRYLEALASAVSFGAEG